MSVNRARASDSKEHLDWFKIDLNATEISTVQDYKCTESHVNIVLKLRVKQVTYESKM